MTDATSNTTIKSPILTVVNMSNGPLEIACQYRAVLGNVLPLGHDKNPIVKWIHGPKNWTVEQQTDSDLPAMPWSQARGIAAIVGAMSDNLVVDFDKQPDRAALDVFLAALNLPPDYEWITITPGGGFHVWVKSPDLTAPDDSIGGKVDRDSVSGGHIELRHTAILVTLPPSRHPDGGRYVFMNGTPTAPPITVEPAALIAAYDAITIKPEPKPAPAYDVPHVDLPSDASELLEIERRALLEIARRLVKRGNKSGVWNCPQDHGPDGKEFYCDPETGKIGGCQGKHAGELKRWRDLADHLQIDVAQIARDVANERRPQRAKRRRRQAIEDTITRLELPAFDAHQRVNLAYISDLPTSMVLDQRAVLIKSALGTGKTEYMKRVIADLGTGANVLVITHRQTLAANLAERLEIENYKTIPDHLLPQASRLVCSYDSLHKIGTARQWDIVIIDEIEQFHRHLFGGTFRGGEAHRAHTALTAVLCMTMRVIGLDAHLTEVSAQWLHHAANTAPYVIVNDYQQDRGALTLYKHESGVVAAAVKAINQDRGPVVITVSSRKRAETIYRLLTDTCGPDGGLLVTGETSSSREIQQFVKEINGPSGIASLRYLVCTSSFGTGLDVTAPVYGVFGVFHNQPLLASDMMQMMMRYRNTETRATYVQHLHASDPRDWLDLYGEALDARAETRIAADFDAARLPPLAAAQHDILRLSGKLTAAANLQRTDLVSYFAAYAESEGFTLAFNNARHNPTRAALTDTQERIAEETAQRVIAAEPVSADQFTQHQLTGTVTQAVIDGHKRWKIEHTAGLTITRPIYDDLRTGRSRAALRRLADVLDDPEHLKGRDRGEDLDNVLLTKRGHYTTRRALVVDGLTLVFGADFVTSAKEITAADLTSCGFVDWCKNHAAQIQRMVDRRDDLSADPMFVLRRLLAAIGLKLGKRQVMHEGERFMLYWLDADHRERWVGMARARLAAMYDDQGITTNAEDQESFRDRSNRVPAPDDPPPLNGDLIGAASAIMRGERNYAPPAA